MKKIASLLAVLAVGSSAYAAEAATNDLSVTVDQTLVNEYVFRGAAFADLTFHPSIEAKYGDAYVGVWGAFEVSDTNGASDRYQEYDLYAGYNFKLNDTWSLDVGATSYQYPDINEAQSFETYVGLNGTVFGLTTTAYLYHDFDIGTYTAQGSVGYSLPIAAIGSSLDLTATLGYQIAGGETALVGQPDDYFYYSVGAAIPYKLADNATLTVGVSLVGASHDEFGVAEYATALVDDLRAVASVGLTVGF